MKETGCIVAPGLVPPELSEGCHRPLSCRWNVREGGPDLRNGIILGFIPGEIAANKSLYLEEGTMKLVVGVGYRIVGADLRCVLHERCELLLTLAAGIDPVGDLFRCISERVQELYAGVVVRALGIGTTVHHALTG